MQNVKIEPVREDHFEALEALFLEFATFQNSAERMKNSLEQMKSEKEYIGGFVAKDENDKVVGYVTCFFAYYTWVGKSMYMDDLYVTPEHRGKGLGAQLLRKVISLAKEQNCKRLRWQVSEWNTPAIEFYKTMGAEIDSGEMNCDIIF